MRNRAKSSGDVLRAALVVTDDVESQDGAGEFIDLAKRRFDWNKVEPLHARRSEPHRTDEGAITLFKSLGGLEDVPWPRSSTIGDGEAVQAELTRGSKRRPCGSSRKTALAAPGSARATITCANSAALPTREPDLAVVGKGA